MEQLATMPAVGWGYNGNAFGEVPGSEGSNHGRKVRVSGNQICMIVFVVVGAI